MSTTNWDKALTYATELLHIEQKFGIDNLNTLLSALLKGGGTFAVSQGKLHTSDFSTHIVKQFITDWTNEEEKPKHFEVLTKQAGTLASEFTFATYDEALDWLTADPLISANANHPYFWANLFEIVLCGGDGCTL